MNIARYMKEHETFVKNHLHAGERGCDLHELKKNHERIIGYIQHERLIHLMVTLSIGAFLLISVAVALLRPCLQMFLLIGLFFVLLVPYLFHYHFLENTLQRWYVLTEEILSAEKNRKA